VVSRVREEDLADLLPLLRGYCDFYGVAPSDEALLALCRALLADPLREGVQLLARDPGGRPVGFATVFWSWSTLQAARLAVMNDLFVAPGARGAGVGEALIEACRAQAREHGAAWLGWQTAKDNATAQRLYERVGATRSEWLDYGLSV
jgi:GNAT superfamily N-acetyltransferase